MAFFFPLVAVLRDGAGVFAIPLALFKRVLGDFTAAAAFGNLARFTLNDGNRKSLLEIANNEVPGKNLAAAAGTGAIVASAEDNDTMGFAGAGLVEITALNGEGRFACIWLASKAAVALLARFFNGSVIGGGAAAAAAAGIDAIVASATDDDTTVFDGVGLIGMTALNGDNRFACISFAIKAAVALFARFFNGSVTGGGAAAATAAAETPIYVVACRNSTSSSNLDFFLGCLVEVGDGFDAAATPLANKVGTSDANFIVVEIAAASSSSVPPISALDPRF